MTYKPPTLPILSLTSSTLPSELYHACKDHGFFYLTNHGIPTSTTNEILNLARRFFLECSDEQKNDVRRRGVEEGGDGARGYQKIGENVTKGARDWHEAVDFYREWDDDGDANFSSDDVKELKGSNRWPEYPVELKEVYEKYIERVKDVGTKVVAAMGEGLGLEESEKDIFVRATRRSFWVMRMIGYPPLQLGEGNEGGVSCGEHTDYGCVTLLLSDSTKGALQVQLKDGSWLTADPIPGAFVVNIGDMMERWTNGEWKSTNHRVIHQASNFRVSVPFFFEPDFDAVVRPLQGCVKRTSGVTLFEDVVYGEHLLKKIKGNFY